MKERVLIHDLESSELAAIDCRSFSTVINANEAYARCVGCFNCWLATPGSCRFKDSVATIGAMVTSQAEVVLISRLVYGGLSPKVKKIWDRCIPGVLPFFRIIDGMMHHVPRYKNRPSVRFYFYGIASQKEREIAHAIAQGNAINFNGTLELVRFCDSPSDLEKVL